MAVDVGVVHVDSVGYRVVGGVGARDERLLAWAVVDLARAMIAASRSLGKPAGTVKIDWDGATLLVSVKNGEVVGVVIEERAGGAPAAGGHAARATV